MASHRIQLMQMEIKHIDPNILTPATFQREFVWSVAKMRGLIDTILRGLPMQPLAVVVIEDTVFGEKPFILDGGQRYKSITEFMADKYTTASRRVPNSRLSPIYPGLLYSQLSPEAKSKFDNYNLPYYKLYDLDDELQRELFRRFQIQDPLTTGEKLYSISEVAVDVVKPIINHRYFSDFYTKNTNRKQQFQIAVIMLALEKAFENRRTPFLNVTGDNLYRFTGELSRSDSPYVGKVIKRLDQILYIYDEVFYESISESIYFYQSVLLLELENVNFLASKKGALADYYWMLNRKFKGKFSLREKDEISHYQLDIVGRQIAFWHIHLGKILAMDGVVVKDKRRSFSQRDRLDAYISQNRKCDICKIPFKGYENAIAHHINPHSNGGSTTSDNLQLLCLDCHAIKHGIKEVPNGQ